MRSAYYASLPAAKETSDDEDAISVDNDDEYNVAEDDDGSQYEQNYEVMFFNSNREVEDEEQKSLQSLLSASSSGDESDVSSLQMSNSNLKVASSSKPAVKPDPSTKPIKKPPRSEKISGFAKMTDHNIFDAIEYLSEESIGRAILKPCCREECLRKKLNKSCLNFEPVFKKILEARRQLVGNEWKDKLLILKAIIQGGVVNSSNKKEESQRMRVEYQLGHEKSSPSICRTAFCNAYGISNYLRKQLSKEVKNGVFHITSAKGEFHPTEAIDSKTLKEIKAMLLDSKVKLPRDLAVNMELPNSIPIFKARSWLTHHFSTLGCNDPTKDEIHVDMVELKEIYTEYVDDIKVLHTDGAQFALSYPRFCWLLQVAFKHVKIREYRSNTGTCLTCAKLSSLRRSTHNSYQRSLLTNLYGLHRGTFMGEKQAYWDRVDETIRNPFKFMSINTDGMDQFKTALPVHVGDDVQRVTQHLQGVIEHGQEVVIYRTFENVRKDSCLAIHCLLLQIERRLTRDLQMNRPAPEVFYLQMDGGMENSNKTTLAISALLVVMGVFKTVVVTRIMRGHGHLDPDRKFGIISRASHSKTLYTPQHYKRFLQKVFSKSESQFEVVDIQVVPDYVKLMEKCIDPKYKLLKGEDTNLQYIFQSVERSERHHLGVKTTYRSFVQNQVFEIVKKNEDGANPLCLGLEPWLTHVHTYPTDEQPPLNVLIDIPFGAIFLHGFKLGCANKLSSAVQSFVRAFPANTESINEWRQFLRLSPQTDLVNDFIDYGGVLHVPLKSVLFSACYLDTGTVIAPLLPPQDPKNINKRTHDGKGIKERNTTCNVPHSNDKASKRSRMPVNPEDDIPPEVLDEKDRAEFIRNVSTLTKEMLTQKQLQKLLDDVNLKTTGNKQVLLDRLQSFYAQKQAQRQKEDQEKQAQKQNEEEEAGQVEVGAGL